MEDLCPERAAKLAIVFDSDINSVCPDSGMKDCFANLEKLLANELKTWWDRSSFRRYVEKNNGSSGT